MVIQAADVTTMRERRRRSSCSAPTIPSVPPARRDPTFAAFVAAPERPQLLDHEALLRGDIEAAIRRVARDAGPRWYRGWMIPSARYEDLSQGLADRGSPLVVHPLDYRRSHELPGWYATFAHLTPDDPGDITLPPLDEIAAALRALAWCRPRARSQRRATGRSARPHVLAPILRRSLDRAHLTDPPPLRPCSILPSCPTPLWRAHASSPSSSPPAPRTPRPPRRPQPPAPAEPTRAAPEQAGKRTPRALLALQAPATEQAPPGRPSEGQAARLARTTRVARTAKAAPTPARPAPRGRLAAPALRAAPPPSSSTI